MKARIVGEASIDKDDRMLAGPCREESTFRTMIGVTPANDGEGRTVSRDSYNSWSIHTFGSQ
jgi:hypothetical protein